MKVFKLLLFIVLLSSLSSCVKDIQPSWSPEYFGPIAKTRINPQHLLVEEGLSLNDENRLKLIYNDTIFSLKLDSSVNSDDTINYKKLTMPISLTVAPGQMFLESDYKGFINSDDLLLKMAVTDTAIIRVKVKSSINEKVRVLFEIPNASKNGKAYSTFEDIDAAPIGDTIIKEKDIYLNGYTFDMSGENGNEYNVIQTKTTFWIHPDADTTVLKKGDVVELLTKLSSLDVRFVKGYLGSSSGNINRNSNFKLFNKLSSGHFLMDSVKASMELHNNIGMDFNFKVNSLSATNSASSSTIALDQSIVGQNINISRAGLIGNQIVTTVYKKDLSPNNVAEFMEAQVNRIDFDFDFATNPMGNISMGNDFLFKDYGADFILNMEIPLNLSFDSLAIIDTLKIEFDDIEELVNAYLKVYINNRFPLNLDLYFTLLDENKDLLDSLNKSGIRASSAITNSDYRAIESTETISKIDLDEVKKDKFLKAKYISLKAVINHNDFGQKYQLSIDDYMDVQIVGNLKLKI